MADVGSQQRCEDDGAPYVGLNHVPAEMLPRPTKELRSTPGGCAPSGQTSCFATRKGHSQEDRAQHDICVELKTCQDTRPTDQLTAARLQHEG
jgi:hypothetical protein